LITFRQLGDWLRVADCVKYRGFAELELGQEDAAVSSFREAIEIQLDAGDEYALLASLIGRGLSHVRAETSWTPSATSVPSSRDGASSASN
jgi:hypothetical protein